MFDDTISLAPPQKQIGDLTQTLPAVNFTPTQHKGLLEAFGQLFGDTAGSMWQDMSGGPNKGQAQIGNPMGIPEDADQAMGQAMQMMNQARSKSQSGGGGNGETMMNGIGDFAKSILGLFAG